MGYTVVSIYVLKEEEQMAATDFVDKQCNLLHLSPQPTHFIFIPHLTSPHLTTKNTHITQMIEDRRSGPPHAAILAAVAVAVMVLPTLIGDQCGAVTDFVAELLSPLGLLLLPITLILAIRFLSSDSGALFAGIFSPADPRRAASGVGSTAGVVVFSLLVLLLLYSRVSIFSGDDDSE